MTTTNFLFKGLQIIAWLLFIGLCIEAGGLIVNFWVSLFKPEFVSQLFQTLDLSEMYKQSKWVFFSMYGFILLIAVLKAILFYEVILLITKIDLTKPFSQFVSKQILQISYYTFAIGISSIMGKQLAKNLMHRGYSINSLNPFWEDGRAFILMAAIIYIIAVIFKKGMEIQTENELTV